MNSILATLGLIASTPFLFFGANAQVAQNADRVDRVNNDDNTELVCTDLSHNLYWGLRDRNTDGEVSDLKAFLRAEGYLNGNNSGVFNGATMRAVMEFQGDSDIPATGFVGPQTRAEIEAISCDDDEESDELAIASIDGPTDLNLGEEGTWTVNVSGDDLGDLRYRVTWGDEGWSPLRLFGAQDDHEQASATFTHVYNDEGTYTPEFTVIDEDGNEVAKEAAAVTVDDEEDTLAISSADPTSGPVGTSVTLEGEGYDGDTRVVIGGKSGLDLNVEDDSTLTFTVPSLDEGDYRIVVRSDEGRSNAVKFTVTEDDDESVVLSIAGLDAPTRLEAGEEGTWTVHVDSNVEGNLSYSADWGEDNGMLRLMTSGADTVQSDATFTHVYREEGTYHPKFTVTDEDGNKTNVSASVVVTDEEND